ncbi:glycoside hydrolase family 15 protein, partial [Patescibacteria group bacterium]|nr:glycoside hydrolase family 15 protein [Patescibacteria group bacterium]
MYKPIRDYGIIGNLRSAALVGKDGSIDWAPAPFLDSPSVFASILDDKKGGQWSIKPTDKFESEQEYIKNTNILLTTFITKRGTCSVMDCLPIKNSTSTTDTAHTATLDEDKEVYEIHRKIVCKKGECEIEVLFFPKFDYARGETKLELVDGGVKATQGDKKGVLISGARYNISKQGAKAYILLKEGETHYLTFRYN